MGLYEVMIALCLALFCSLFLVQAELQTDQALAILEHKAFQKDEVESARVYFISDQPQFVSDHGHFMELTNTFLLDDPPSTGFS